MAKKTEPYFFYGTGEIAAFFDITRTQVGNWVKLGCPKEGRGKFDLKQVHEWCLTNIYGNKNQTDDENINQTKHEYWQHKTRNEKAKADLVEGAVIKKEDILREWTKRVHEIASGLDALRMRLAPVVYMVEDKRAVEKAIDDEVWALRDSYYRTGTYCPEIDMEKCSECGGYLR